MQLDLLTYILCLIHAGYFGHHQRQWKTNNSKDEDKYMHETIIKVRVFNNNNKIIIMYN